MVSNIDMEKFKAAEQCIGPLNNLYVALSQANQAILRVDGREADGVQAMRQTVAELRPTELEDLGLEYVVENYVEEFRKSSGIACELRLPDEGLRLGIRQSTALVRIVQEPLANVAKHAGATKVSIALGAWGEAVVPTINDNGKGFDLNSRKSITFGLLGAIERAAMVGGKAEVSSAPGKGTAVRVSLPGSA